MAIKTKKLLNIKNNGLTLKQAKQLINLIFELANCEGRLKNNKLSFKELFNSLKFCLKNFKTTNLSFKQTLKNIELFEIESSIC